jgi:hypothetical protein
LRRRCTMEARRVKPTPASMTRSMATYSGVGSAGTRRNPRALASPSCIVEARPLKYSNTPSSVAPSRSPMVVRRRNSGCMQSFSPALPEPSPTARCRRSPAYHLLPHCPLALAGVGRRQRCGHRASLKEWKKPDGRGEYRLALARMSRKCQGPRPRSGRPEPSRVTRLAVLTAHCPGVKKSLAVVWVRTHGGSRTGVALGRPARAPHICSAAQPGG